MIEPAALDELKARNPVADVAGRYVRLRSRGGRLVGPCPICGGRDSSAQRFEVLVNENAWVCAVCQDGGDAIRLVQRVEGLDFRAAIERLGGARDLDPAVARRLDAEREARERKRQAEAERYREAERRRLFDLWSAAGPIAGTPVEAYLAGRGLMLPPRCRLRAHPAVPYFHGERQGETGRREPVLVHRGWAMLGAFVRPDGRFGGLHLTFIETPAPGRPPGKLQLTDPETGEILPAKKMRGSKTGAAIRVADAAGPLPRRLVVGEGIETVLAVLTAHVVGGRDITATDWRAAGDLGNLAGRAAATLPHPTLTTPAGRPQRVPGPDPDPADPGLAIPPSVDELVLLGDGDSEPVLTRHAMARAAKRYAAPGRRVVRAFAPQGMDFNDLLRGGQ